MNFKIGDTVVHWLHGVGSVIDVTEIVLSGLAKKYYVVETGIMKLMVPVEDETTGSIRFPLDQSQFRKMFEILRTPGQPLPERPFDRKQALRERMRSKTLAGMCHLIRDLTDLSRLHRLSIEDSSTLVSAEEHLLDEWVISLGTDRSNAERELVALLR